MKEMIDDFDGGVRDFNDEAMINKGLRQWDKATIHLLQGKRRKMVLDRKSYLFKLKKHISFHRESYVVLIPSLQCNNAVFGMFLSESDSDNSRRYIFKSLSNIPFKLNGNFCYEAHLIQGDVVDLDYNRIEFGQSGKEKVENYFQNTPIEKIVLSEMDLLLLGETGTGKSKMAFDIHLRSKRPGNFVQINPASFCEGVVESELFGHVQGAFTGACRHKRGSMTEADGGTLFIDEIDSLPLSLQVKLLLFLDTKKIRPVGGLKDKKVDVRLVFASGKNLSDMVRDKKMRSDFYYRITSGFTITLIPLRSDKHKIKMICEDYLLKTSSMMSAELMDFYMDCKWPGNIRQLMGHLEKKKTIYAKEKWRFDEMDEQLKKEFLPVESDEYRFFTIEQVKVQYACRTYLFLGKKFKETARVLKISGNTLRSFLKKGKLTQTN